MQTMDALRNIGDEQYWAVEMTERAGAQLKCVDKPGWICCLLQAWNFAEVTYVVKTVIEGGQNIDRSAIDKLAGRYSRFLEEQSFFTEIITDLFLWVIGYRGGNDLDGMICNLVAAAPAPAEFKWVPHRGSTSSFDAQEGQLEKDYAKTIEPMMKKIAQSQYEGKKICLLIGRTPAEPLPAQENELWISGDKEIRRAIREDRLHFWLDFNRSALPEKLFDRIVVDFDTVQYLDHDFAKRFSLMLRNDESECIFPAFPGLVKNGDNIRSFNPKTYNVRLKKAEEPDEEAMTWGRAQLGEHLKTIFETVELHSKEDFPCKGSDGASHSTYYFVVKQPKRTAG